MCAQTRLTMTGQVSSTLTPHNLFNSFFYRPRGNRENALVIGIQPSRSESFKTSPSPPCVPRHRPQLPIIDPNQRLEAILLLHREPNEETQGTHRHYFVFAVLGSGQGRPPKPQKAETLSKYFGPRTTTFFCSTYRTSPKGE